MLKTMVKKKSNIALVALVLFSSYWIYLGIGKHEWAENAGMLSLIAVALTLLFFYLLFEQSESSSKSIAAIAALSALSVGGRILFAPLPSIQPSTFLIIVSGWVFGPIAGFMVGSTTALLSNFFLGHGPWTPWQMLAWGICGFVSGLCGKSSVTGKKWPLSIYCAAWGFLYGWIVNAYFVLGFVKPLSLASIFSVYAASAWFDLLHAAGNFAFAFLFGEDLIKILSRYHSRFFFQAETIKLDSSKING
ncbi:MAG: ECF transporter S component [Actinomycetota bacterium]|nr:ECF transporter S component [Actinomycetota bacterium]